MVFSIIWEQSLWVLASLRTGNSQPRIDDLLSDEDYPQYGAAFVICDFLRAGASLSLLFVSTI
jgi:hypothetical protein